MPVRKGSFGSAFTASRRRVYAVERRRPPALQYYSRRTESAVRSWTLPGQQFHEFRVVPDVGGQAAHHLSPDRIFLKFDQGMMCTFVWPKRHRMMRVVRLVHVPAKNHWPNS